MARSRLSSGSERRAAGSLLRPHCTDIRISTRADQVKNGERSRYPATVDSWGDIGPIGGILSAFRKQPGAAWLVLACDMPFLDQSARTLRQLGLRFWSKKRVTGRIWPSYDPLWCSGGTLGKSIFEVLIIFWCPQGGRLGPAKTPFRRVLSAVWRKRNPVHKAFGLGPGLARRWPRAPGRCWWPFGGQKSG